jgi:hypothetical protein
MHDVPEEVRIAACAAADAYKIEMIKNNARMRKSFYRLRLQKDAAIQSAIGPKKYQDYITLRDGVRTKLRNIVMPAISTAEDSAIYVNTRNQVLSEARQRIDGLGIDSERLKEIKGRYTDRALSLVKPPLLDDRPRSLVKRPVLDERVQAYAPVAGSQNATPVELKAPYASATVFPSGHAEGEGTWSTGGTALDEKTGIMEIKQSISNLNADGDDRAYVNQSCLLDAFFRMPVTAAIRIETEFSCLDALRWSGTMLDELGVSGGYCRVFCFHSCHIFIKDVRYESGNEVLWSAVVVFHDTDHSWTHSRYVRPDTVRRSYSPRYLYAEGTWLKLSVGFIYMNDFHVDDVGCWSELSSTWYLPRFTVQPLG